MATIISNITHKILRRKNKPESQQGPYGYCVHCRKKVTMMNPKSVTMKNGRPAIQGHHYECGTKIFKIGKL